MANPKTACIKLLACLALMSAPVLAHPEHHLHDEPRRDDRYRELEILERLFAFAGESQCKTQVGKRAGIVRIALDSLLKQRNRLLLTSSALQRHRQLKLTARQVGVQLDRLRELVDRFIVFARRSQASAIFQHRLRTWRFQGACGLQRR